MQRKITWGIVAGLAFAVPVSFAACSSSSSGNKASAEGGSGTEGGSGVDSGGGTDTGGGTDGNTGAETGGGGGDGGFPTPTSECTQYATAKCAQDATCNTDALMTNFGTTTQSACVSQEALLCTIYEQAANTGFTAPNIQTCTTAIQNSTSCPATPPSPSGPCNFAGTGAAGAACGVNYQCASLSCNRTGGVACGTCDAVAQVGAACGGTSNAACAVGLTCDGTTHKCITLVGAGQVCDDGQHQCTGNTFSCLHVDGGATGTCQTASTTAGAPCSRAGLGGLVGCQNVLGLYCAGDNQCTAISYASSGTCGEPDGGASDTRCIQGSCTAGSCVANSNQVGATCTIGKAPNCGWALQCVNATAGAASGTCQIDDSTNCH